MAAQSKVLRQRSLPPYLRTRPPLVILLACILILRSRILTGPRDILSSLMAASGRHKLSKEELAKALQQLYVEGRDGTKELLVPFRENISKASIRLSSLSDSISFLLSICLPNDLVFL